MEALEHETVEVDCVSFDDSNQYHRKESRVDSLCAGAAAYLEEEVKKEFEEQHPRQEELRSDDTELMPQRARKPAPPPPTGDITRQSNIQPSPGAYHVAPGRSVTRALANTSDESSVDAAQVDSLASSPQALPSLVEAEPVISSVLVQATPVDADVVHGAAYVDGGSGPSPTRRKYATVFSVLAAVTLTAAIVGVVVWATTRENPQRSPASSPAPSRDSTLWSNDDDSACSVSKNDFNACVNDSQGGISSCERCIVLSWSPDAKTCSQIVDETCTALSSSTCSKSCEGCKPEFRDYFECISGCSLTGCADARPSTGTNSTSSSPDRCPEESTNFWNCPGFASTDDADACENYIAGALNSFTALDCSDFTEVLCPLLEDPVSGWPCDGCQYQIQQWLSCLFATSSSSSGCDFTCGFGSNNNQDGSSGSSSSSSSSPTGIAQPTSEPSRSPSPSAEEISGEGGNSAGTSFGKIT